jgi:hypothetical protein
MKKLESYSSILAVPNLDVSLSFYPEKLGFTVESSYGSPRMGINQSRSISDFDPNLRIRG